MEASLKRLQTDYIDLLQIHRFDKDTPIEETMEALHDLVRSGKIRYIGASSMWTYQFANMQFCAEKHGWTKFVSMQNHYNLLYREEEREMNKFCDETGVGLIPVSFCISFCRRALVRLVEFLCRWNFCALLTLVNEPINVQFSFKKYIVYMYHRFVAGSLASGEWVQQVSLGKLSSVSRQNRPLLSILNTTNSNKTLTRF